MLLVYVNMEVFVHQLKIFQLKILLCTCTAYEVQV